uniref:Uncharacterized protein n=1 Tax=Cajanus cajan TaxID=3821 RepID=A0A151SX76_CAJCA|nr:hypothetical protein KK1_014841 [Cajanus cajan]
MPPPPPVPEDSKGWEILKSVVYGGLAELLASLSVVTSAASADATTLSIVALGIANLIGGLSVLGHNVSSHVLHLATWFVFVNCDAILSVYLIFWCSFSLHLLLHFHQN